MYVSTRQVLYKISGFFIGRIVEYDQAINTHLRNITTHLIIFFSIFRTHRKFYVLKRPKSIKIFFWFLYGNSLNFKKIEKVFKERSTIADFIEYRFAFQ